MNDGLLAALHIRRYGYIFENHGSFAESNLVADLASGKHVGGRGAGSTHWGRSGMGHHRVDIL